MSTKLDGVHPALIAAVERILAAMRVLGFEMIVTDGIRSTAEQKALYAKGRSAPGPIVTNTDGVTHLSNHQARDDGFGAAVDMCFLVDDLPSWGESNPWHLYGAMAKALGLVWGGDWAAIKDRPHIEMK